MAAPQDPTQPSSPPRLLRWLLGGALLVQAALLLPPVWQALDPLAGIEAPWGWLASGLWLALAVGVALFPGAWGRRLGDLAIAPLLLLTVELGFRLGLRDPAAVARQRAPLEPADGDVPLMVPHPFLGFTGNPAHPSYNGLGFSGPDWSYTKPPGVQRVACLGASTTASGWPEDLQQYLDRVEPGAWEVMNFALPGWTSAHSLGNYVLNVRDFAPDWVVVHHAWNDRDQLRMGHCPRRDYFFAGSLALPVGAPRPSEHELAMLRGFVAWRALRLPAVRDLQDQADALVPHDQPDVHWGDCEEVEPFWALRRNLETLADLAAVDGTQVLLLTLPRSRDASVGKAEDFEAIGRGNDVSRALASERPELELIDLDARLAGRIDLFNDVAHVTSAGRALKAKAVADVLLAPAVEEPAPAEAQE